VHAVTGAVSAPARLPSAESVMAQAGSENFTVASAVLGRRRCADLLALYGFARLVDDVGDEAPGDRAALLDLVEGQLDDIYAGREPDHPLMRTLAATVHERRLPDGPFRRLIAANRQDQVVTRYETFAQLLDYCQLSAAPVGELVLHVFDAATPERVVLSDRVCAALQVIEHLQDIDEDHARGRVYMPRQDMISVGCDDGALVAHANSARRALIALEARRARSLLAGGAPLAATLPVRPRLAVAGFVAGGRCALDALQRSEPRSRRALARAYLRAAAGR